MQFLRNFKTFWKTPKILHAFTISFYGDVSGAAICNHKTDNLPTQMTIFSTVIPFLMHLLHILSFQNILLFTKVNLCHQCKTERQPMKSCVSEVKPSVSQWKTMLHNDVRVPTVYHRIYHCKVLTSSHQTSHYIHKALEYCICPPHEHFWQNTLINIRFDAKTTFVHQRYKCHWLVGCVEAYNQQFFSHVGTEPSLPG